MSDRERTVDLSIERGYAVDIPQWYGVKIGKVHGIGQRENQEDAFAISEIDEQRLSERGVLAVLADGMGGMADGEKASVATVISCLQYFEQSDLTEEWMRDMAYEANEKVLDALGDAAGIGGSTLIAVHIDGTIIDWVSVGDSHLYLYRNGKLKQLNQDHIYGNVLDQMVRNHEISEEEALHHAQRKALTSYMGLRNLEEIDSCEERMLLQSKDLILMMTDGIFGTLTEKEIIEKLDQSVAKIAMGLQMEIENKKKMNQDNYTGILIYFE